MKRVIIQLDHETLADLDEATRETGVSRAALVRAAVRSLLAERRRRRELQAVVDAFAADEPEDLTAPRRVLRKAWPD